MKEWTRINGQLVRQTIEEEQNTIHEETTVKKWHHRFTETVHGDQKKK